MSVIPRKEADARRNAWHLTDQRDATRTRVLLLEATACECYQVIRELYRDYPRYYPQPQWLYGVAKTVAFSCEYSVCGSLRWGVTVCKRTTMAIAAPPVFAEDKSSELEAGIHKLARTAPPFGKPIVATAKCRPRISAICCAGYQEHRWMKLTISSESFKRSGKNYRPMAIALNGTSPNTRY